MADDFSFFLYLIVWLNAHDSWCIPVFQDWIVNHYCKISLRQEKKLLLFCTGRTIMQPSIFTWQVASSTESNGVSDALPSSRLFFGPQQFADVCHKRRLHKRPLQGCHYRWTRYENHRWDLELRPQVFQRFRLGRAMRGVDVENAYLTIIIHLKWLVNAC